MESKLKRRVIELIVSKRKEFTYRETCDTAEEEVNEGNAERCIDGAIDKVKGTFIGMGCVVGDVNGNANIGNVSNSSCKTLFQRIEDPNVKWTLRSFAVPFDKQR